MSDFRNVTKRFMKFVRYGNIDRDIPYPDEVRELRELVGKLLDTSTSQHSKRPTMS
jgi:hypothetical protein